ncbi:type VI secretion protein (plasmid) [Acinetobacter baumannii]|uniref:type VI secretion protein n=1 Tax=Acinetobacter baumannii TaxID=470 RepID=UPI003891D982
METIDILQNMGFFFVAATEVLRYFFVVSGFYVFLHALVDFVQISQPALAGRFMTQIRRPSAFGASMKLIIAAFLCTLGLRLQLLDIVGSLISDTTPAGVTYYDYTQYTGSSYTDELNLAVLVIIGVLQFFGLLAIGRGLWIWRDNADGIAKLSVGQGTMFMIGGMLAYKVEVVHAFLASWFGLDFFKIIGLT